MATEQEGHTRGPWLCTGAKFPDDDIGGVYYRIEAAGIDMRAANARLIAAAPDLLKAGDGARQALWNALDHLGFECPDAHPAIVELDAAIARATGEA